MWPFKRKKVKEEKEEIKEAYIKFYLNGEKILFDFELGDYPEDFFLMLSEIMSGNLNSNVYNNVVSSLDKSTLKDFLEEAREFDPENRPLIDPTQYK